LCARGSIDVEELKLFAYENDGGRTLPRVRADADERSMLEPDIFMRKYHVMTTLYGFGTESWEARATPEIEGFYRSNSPAALAALVQRSSQ
jgi:hypothetical protein